jgi:hypothetical protein
MLAALLFLLPPGLARAAETNQAPVIFHVGLAQICFRDVNRIDARAAYKTFLESRGRLLGKTYVADPEVFDDTPTFEAAIQHQPMHMAVMDAWQFLTMDIHQQMKPYFAIRENGKVGRNYVVLTRRDSGLDTLRSLRGRELLVLEVASYNVGKTWLDTRLLTEGLETQEMFFGGQKVVAKPTSAILPVFFGKAAACMVDGPSFAVMTELNPQVGERLQTVAVSDTFADVVVCLSENYWSCAKDKIDTIQSMTDLGQDPLGQQICTMFKIDGMVPFQDSQLDTLRKLRASYESLRTGAARANPRLQPALPPGTINPPPLGQSPQIQPD